MQAKTAGLSIAAFQDIAIGVDLAMHAAGMEQSTIHPSAWASVSFPPKPITHVLPLYTSHPFTTGTRTAGIFVDRKLVSAIGVGMAICVAGMPLKLTLKSAAMLELSPHLSATFVSSLQGLHQQWVATRHFH